MAGINWYIPLDTNAIPSNINSIIAQGPQNVPNLGTASQDFINNYYAGQNQAYQQRNQNAFPNGLPTVKNPDGSTATDTRGNPLIDYSAIGNILAKARGTNNIGSAVATAQFPAVQQAMENAGNVGSSPQASSPPSSANAIPSQNVAGPPNAAGGSQTTDQSLTPQQVASANPNGTPQAVSTPQTTPRMLSNQTGVNAAAIAQTAGVGLDDPIPAQNRRAVFNLLKSSPPGSATGAPLPSPPPSSSGPQAQQVAQAPQQQAGVTGQPGQNLQPGGDLQAQADRAQAVADKLYQVAASPLLPKQTSDALKARADAAARTAQQFRDAALQAGKPTPDILNARASGMASPLDYQGAAKEQETQIGALNKLADNGIDARGKLTQLNAVQQLGEKVGYGVIPSLQSFLGEYGINTDGLSDIQSYERAIDFMAPQLRPVGSGRLMQKELDSFKAALGGLMTTPEGRRISLENLKLINQYSVQVGDIASDTSITPAQRYKQIYSLTPPKLNIPQIASVPQSQGQQFQEGQTATNPQTGQRAIFKSGQWQMLQ